MEAKQIYLSLKREEHLEEALYLYKTAGLKKSDIFKNQAFLIEQYQKSTFIRDKT